LPFSLFIVTKDSISPLFLLSIGEKKKKQIELFEKKEEKKVFLYMRRVMRIAPSVIRYFFSLYFIRT
jgi:hypothetical protein